MCDISKMCGYCVDISKKNRIFITVFSQKEYRIKKYHRHWDIHNSTDKEVQKEIKINDSIL